MYKLLILMVAINVACINSSAAQVANKTIDTVIVNFVYQATLLGLQEVNSAELATSKSKTSDVKLYAEATIKSYTVINERLKALVAKNKYQMPAHIDESVAPAQPLEHKTVDNFDSEYIGRAMKMDKKMLSLFTRASTVFTDSELKEFIAQTLPVLRKRHDESIMLSSKKLNR